MQAEVSCEKSDMEDDGLMQPNISLLLYRRPIDTGKQDWCQDTMVVKILRSGHRIL